MDTKLLVGLLYSDGQFIRVADPQDGGRSVQWNVWEQTCIFDYVVPPLFENEDVMILRADQVSGPRLTRSKYGKAEPVFEMIEKETGGH